MSALLLWARHHAWLTAPQKTKDGKGKQTDIPSRWVQTCRGRGIPANEVPGIGPEDLPPLTWDASFHGDELAEHLFRVGPVASGGKGLSGVTWREIEAWAALTVHILAPWDYEALAEMSEAYARMLHKAEDPHEPAPWSTAEAKKARAPSAKALGAMLGAGRG